MPMHSSLKTRNVSVRPAVQRPEIGYNGVLYEPIMGWQLLGNGRRAYNPVLMRFHSPDPLSPFGAGGINSYAYCGCDPVNRIDPSGMFFMAAARSIFSLITTQAQRAIGIARSAWTSVARYGGFVAPNQLIAPRPGSATLPNELLGKIASHLTNRDLVTFGMASRRFGEVANIVSRNRPFQLSVLKMTGARLENLAGNSALPGFARRELANRSRRNRDLFLPHLERYSRQSQLSNQEVSTIGRVLSGEATGIMPTHIRRLGWTTDAARSVRTTNRGQAEWVYRNGWRRVHGWEAFN